jgi:hypothetical protein
MENVHKFAVYAPFNISLMKKSVKWGEQPQIHPDSMWQSGSEKQFYCQYQGGKLERWKIVTININFEYLDQAAK